MMRFALDRRAILKLGLRGAAAALVETIHARRAAHAATALDDSRERHLRNVRQLTFGGQNAEAYWDHTGTRLIFQSTRPPFGCDQIFTMHADGSAARLVSTGKGRTTCAFFFPDGRRFIYASTHLGGDACPPPPDRSSGYVWPIYPTYDIFAADVDGSSGVTRLTTNDGYDAEGAISPDGRRIVFTSLRDGDLDLYAMDADGGNVRRLTDGVGYDGGPFFSWDGRFIVYRAARHEPGADVDEYRALLRQSLVRPRRLELFVMDADGGGKRQVTKNGAANFAPFMHPDSRRIIFSSNLHDPGGRSFALFITDIEGRHVERVTWADGFASFPMFSRDGRRLVFSSSRNAAGPRDLNVFVADWVD